MATTSSILRAGDVVGGFRVDDVIGYGGMAIVYRAEQVSLGRPVALKVLSGRLTSDALFRERFRREGKHAAALEHPNIVPVYDSGEYEGLLYLAMRLVEGTNLAELVETRGLTVDQTIELLSPIAGALDTAHAAGLIHRDVKPQNILITPQWHPYLADFGVAKGSNTYGLTVTGGFVGSVNYASPEQIKGLTLTPASDVYALTAVLYHCLTGVVPYPRETDAGIMHAHLNEPPPTLATTGTADTDFHTVLARGMAKDPGSRYGHAGDLLTAAALSASRLPAKVRQAVPAFPPPPGAETGVHPDEAGLPRSSAEVVASEHGDWGNPEPAGSPEAPVGDSVTPVSDPAPAQEIASAAGAAGLVGGTEVVAANELDRGRGFSSHTTADQRRAPAPEPEPTPVQARRPGRRVIAMGAAAIAPVAAILLAVVLAGGGTSTRTARDGLVQLAYATPWRQVAAPTAAVDGLRLVDAVALTTPSGSLTAGSLANGGPVPGSLPAQAQAALGTHISQSTTTLGKIAAVEYATLGGAQATGSRIFVIPTDRGDLGMLCTTPTAASLGACLTVADTLTVLGAQAVAPGPDRQLASQLNASLASATAARGRANDLDSAKVQQRGVAAGLIATADRRSAASLSGLSSEPRDTAMVKALATTIGSEASALTALAGAATHNDAAAYSRATAAVHRADGQLESARRVLVAAGFTSLSALSQLTIAAWPAVHHAKPVIHQTASASTAATSPEPARSAPVIPTTPAPTRSAPAHHASPEYETAKPLT
jgi:serine/threonine protein kinase